MIIIIGLIGIIFGSFINALVWRLHEQEALRGRVTKKSSKRRRDLSIATGRSMCPDCGHTLAAQDLIPVLSWIGLRGKCRYCNKHISWQYPLIELLTSGLFILSYFVWPVSFDGPGTFRFVLWLIFVISFVALAVYDLRWSLLPDRIVIPMTGLAVLQVIVLAVWQHDLALLWQPALGAFVIFGLFWSLLQVSNGAWIGGGDVKLSIVLGLLVGTPLYAFMVIFFASLLGTLASIPLLLRGRKGFTVQIPFGPYLLLATFIVVLFGHVIANWYQNLFIL